MDTILEQSDAYNPILYSGTIIASNSSTLQSWKIMDTADEGEILFIDNQLQSCKNDEYIYHEMFVHSLMAGCANKKRVLILGGAEGCVLREVLKWNDVISVVQVDWDMSLIDYFKGKGVSWNNNSYADERVTVITKDAIEWLKETNEMFDCIFIDLLDPTNVYMPFFKGLFDVCKHHLTKYGGLIMNAGCINKSSTVNISIEFKKILQDMNMEFSALHIHVPSFKDEWTFLMTHNKLWSSIIHDSVLPSDIKYYSKDVLIKSLQWSENDNFFLKTFWKDIPYTKKLINNKLISEPIDFSSIHAC